MDIEKNLQEQIFCLTYELKTLAAILTTNKLERWVPGFTDVFTDFDHTQRYKWACEFVKGKNVLDIACGSGMGSYLMATEGKASNVTGCDIEKDAIKYASIKFKWDNITFKIHDATTFNENQKFDVIVSFETIEHIAETDLYLNVLNKHLHDNGIFIVSTPISPVEKDMNPKNPYHVVEWGFKNFQRLISEKFVIKKVFVQLHDAKAYSFLEMKLNRFFPKSKDFRNTRIEEFSEKIAVNKLGKQIEGYQILICGKKKD
jgi:2-polyprenyl-3-methyl-5-hydroxy-6-metoxy-1,4-benzoquinol methylase